MIDGERDVCEQFDALLKEQGFTAAFVAVSEWIQEGKHRITRDDVQRLCVKHASAIAGYAGLGANDV